MQREVRFNDLFNATFETILANRTATLLFLAVTVPIGGASVALLDTASGNPAVLFSPTSRSLGTVAGIVAMILFGMVAQYWFIMAMLRRSLHGDFDRLLPYLGISLLSTIGLVLGMLLLVIPGFIFATRCLLVTPMVLERKVPAMDSFVESWERTQSNAWSIFFVIVVLLMLIWIPNGLGQFLSDRLTGNARIAGWLIESLTSPIWTTVGTGMMVGAYRLLGDPHRELEEVFA
jgi:hypothetical protein